MRARAETAAAPPPSPERERRSIAVAAGRAATAAVRHAAIRRGRRSRAPALMRRGDRAGAPWREASPGSAATLELPIARPGANVLTSRKIRLLALVFLGAAAVRIAFALRPGLWLDEVFSLAMATGHSLEHAAAAADSAFGDYVETLGPQAPSVWRRYAEHDSPAADLGRVLRAVLRSDTHPPLYTLLLTGWTRLVGTSDAALRLFSTLWALACLPFVWVLVRQMDGERTASVALLLFAAAPASIYFAVEGRMYSTVWFLGIAFSWLTLRLHDEGARPVLLGSWVLAATAGLLTHYFFAFVAAACGLWLLSYPGSCRRRHLLAAGTAVGLLVLPWYMRVPDTFLAWRVTGNWLKEPVGLPEALRRALQLAGSFVSGRGVSARPWAPAMVVALLGAGIAGWLFVRRDWSPFRPRVQLLWAWAGASVLGICAFDLVLGTGAARIARYALPGLPAALLLLAVLVARLPRQPGWGSVALLVLAWAPGIVEVYRGPSNPLTPFREIAAIIEQAQPKPDLVIVDSIPSGVVGVSRYFRSEIPLASWVVALGQVQTPARMTELAAGRCRITLVKVHRMKEWGDSPPEVWLRANAILERAPLASGEAEILDFRPEDPAGACAKRS